MLDTDWIRPAITAIVIRFMGHGIYKEIEWEGLQLV